MKIIRIEDAEFSSIIILPRYIVENVENLELIFTNESTNIKTKPTITTTYNNEYMVITFPYLNVDEGTRYSILVREIILDEYEDTTKKIVYKGKAICTNLTSIELQENNQSLLQNDKLTI